MPFVTKKHRESPDHAIPGDRCFIWYRWLMSEWKKEPRWTTVDKLYVSIMRQCTRLESQRAKELAWQVFFNKVVMPYEDQKEKENGGIE